MTSFSTARAPGIASPSVDSALAASVEVAHAQASARSWIKER